MLHTNPTPSQFCQMNQDTDQELKKLENKVARLVELCDRLSTENRSLKAKQNELVRERARLIEKAALAKNRVEAMISRLKSMGQGS